MKDVVTKARPKLKKEVGTFGFFSLAFGSMIGVGWVTAMGSWLAQAGSVGAIVAFALGGLLMLFIGLCYAEITSLLPVAGGEVAYAYKAFGVGKSFWVGWFLSFGYLSVSAFEAISIGAILSFLIPSINVWPVYAIGGEVVYLPHIILAIFFTFLITLVNYTGVKTASRFQGILISVFLAFTMIFIIAALYSGKPENLKPLYAGNSGIGILAGIASVMVTVPFWFVGFDTIPQSAEEAKSSVSYRKLGLIILIAIISAVFFYMLLIFSTSLLGNRGAILSAELPTAEAFRLALNNEWMVDLILLAALVGLITSWNGFFLAASRVLFALGRGQIISGKLGAAHRKYQSPYRAVIFCGIVTILAALLGRGAMIAFVNVGSLCIAVAFVGVSFSFLKLKKIVPGARPYNAPMGKTTGYISLAGGLGIIMIMLAPFSPASLKWPLEWTILVIFCSLGWFFWKISAKSREATDKDERDYLILENFK